MSPTVFQALTVRQPWANLLVTGVKHIETRGWHTAVRGRVAVHAAKSPAYLRAVAPKMRSFTTGNEPLGCVVGSVDLVDCIPLEEVKQKYPELYTEQEIDLGDWRPGRYGFIMRSPIQYPRPLPAKGKLGWWKWDADEWRELIQSSESARERP